MILFTRSNQLCPFTREILDAHATGKQIFLIQKQCEDGQWEDAGRIAAKGKEDAIFQAYETQMVPPTVEIRVMGISAMSQK